MADNTVQIATTDSWVARNKWLLLLIAVGLIVLGAYVVTTRFYTLSEEPPIRVKNGSMDLKPDVGNWGGDLDGWLPSSGNSTGRYKVKVFNGPNHFCDVDWKDVSGTSVELTYSDGFKAVIMTPPSGNKTFVTGKPKDKLAPVTPGDPILRHGAPGDSEYIASVTVRGGGRPATCTFGKKEDLVEIVICTPTNAKCDCPVGILNCQ